MKYYVQYKRFAEPFYRTYGSLNSAREVMDVLRTGRQLDSNLHYIWARYQRFSTARYPGLLLQPPINHGMGLKFCIFARSVGPVGTRFNTFRIYGDGPEVGLDPRTNGVAHPSVVHGERSRPTRSRSYSKWTLGFRVLPQEDRAMSEPLRNLSSYLPSAHSALAVAISLRSS
jgi:hypothetical protein